MALMKERYPTLQVVEQPEGFELRGRIRGYGPDEVEAAFAVGLAKLSARGIDAQRIEASVQDGALSLRIPRNPSAAERDLDA